jgi:hypothetical protein
MKRLIRTSVIALAIAPMMASAAPLALKFEEAKSMTDVFAVKEAGKATALTNYMPYNEWKEKQSGKFFPMEVSPVLAGMLSGGVNMPAAVHIDPAAYKDQAREFAEVVNTRNQGGRPTIAPSPLPPQKRYAEDQAKTYVVQTVLATVLPRPLGQLKLNTENFASIIENADLDHYHFRIPGSFAVQALEKDHIAAKNMAPNTAYLLSVIDFRQYGCAAIRDGLRDYFSKEENKKKLMNESMYLISDLTMNVPADMAAAEKMFGKKPDAVLGQQVVFADRLIRGARTMFIFYSEGANTRVVLVSNIGMQSKHFVGTKGALARGVILHGINGSLTGTAAVVYNSPTESLSRLLGVANEDVRNKNSCDRGLAKGLIRYAQGLFGEFLSNL